MELKKETNLKKTSVKPGEYSYIIRSDWDEVVKLKLINNPDLLKPIKTIIKVERDYLGKKYDFEQVSSTSCSSVV